MATLYKEFCHNIISRIEKNLINAPKMHLNRTERCRCTPFQGAALSTEPGRMPGSHRFSWKPGSWSAGGERAEEFTATVRRVALQTQETVIAQFVYWEGVQTVKGKDIDSCWPRDRLCWSGQWMVGTGQKPNSLCSHWEQAVAVLIAAWNSDWASTSEFSLSALSLSLHHHSSHCVISVTFSFRLEYKLMRDIFCHSHLGICVWNIVLHTVGNKLF